MSKLSLPLGGRDAPRVLYRPVVDVGPCHPGPGGLDRVVPAGLVDIRQ